MKKAELLKMLDYAQGIATDFEAKKSKVERDENLTQTGKDNAILSLVEEYGVKLENATKTASDIILKGIDELTAKWEKQSLETYADTTLINALATWKNGIVADDFTVKAFAEKYADNPIARGLIRETLTKTATPVDVAWDIKADDRAYTLDLLKKTANGISEINRNSLKNSGFIPVDIQLADKKEFITDRLNNDLSLV